jgi:hypothetical protein
MIFYVTNIICTVLMILTLCIFLSCSNDPSECPDIDRVYLVPTDTVLCIEPDILDEVCTMYDYQLTDSAVYVLDHISRHVVRICLADGSRLLIGRSGQAPGELLNPVGFVVTDGIVRVTDTVQGMVCYDTCGRYLQELSYFDNNLPLNLRHVRSEGYLGLRSTNFFDENDELAAHIAVSLYETSNQPTVEYYSFTMHLNLENIADALYCALNAVCYAANEINGNVYVAIRSTNHMIIHGYNSTGEIIFALDEQVDPITMTQNEIDSERLGLQWSPIMARFSNDVEIAPNRLQIKSIGVDSLGNVWIETATAECPSFVVLSQPDGDTLFIAEAQALAETGRNYDIRVSSSGIIARETKDDGTLVLYLMEIEYR